MKQQNIFEESLYDFIRGIIFSIIVLGIIFLFFLPALLIEKYNFSYWVLLIYIPLSYLVILIINKYT